VLILIGGGSRSGKSRYALDYARRIGGPAAFIATAETLDDEMSARARAHRSDRGDTFTTVEEPVELERALADTCQRFRSVVVDCLTLWISNLMLRGIEPSRAARSALEFAAASPAAVIFVTNEVGCGIVPENELARRFRDEAGAINQQAAASAHEVYWMVFGIPVRVK
jgi:adenosylcobinamide kinase/adenosylcobinamide-phosphate guanylyltransferase